MATQDLEEIGMEDSYQTDPEEKSDFSDDGNELDVHAADVQTPRVTKSLSTKDAAKRSAAQLAHVPIPYLGQPFVTKSLVSTIDVNLLRDLCKKMIMLEVQCIALGSNDSSKTLQHVLFENPVSFSGVAGKCSYEVLIGLKECTYNFIFSQFEDCPNSKNCTI